MRKIIIKSLLSLLFSHTIISNIYSQTNQIEINTRPLSSVKLEKKNYYNCDFPRNDFGEIEYKQVVDCDKPKDIIFASVQNWILRTFGNYKSIVQLEDKLEGKIVLKGYSKIKKESTSSSFMGMSLSNREELSYIISIECKDGKYRYTLSDLSIIIYSNDTPLPSRPLDFRCKDLEYSDSKQDNIDWIISENEQVDMIIRSLRNDICKIKSDAF